MNTAILRALAIFLGLAVSVIVGTSVGASEFVIPIVVAIFLIGILVGPGLYQLGCLLIFMVSPLIERGLGLPFGLGPYHFVAASLCVMLGLQVAFKRQAFTLGDTRIVTLNAVIACILIYHISSGGLGAHAFGATEVAGGRRYFNFFFAVIGFILVHNLPLPSYFGKYLWLFALPAPLLVAATDVTLYFAPQLLPIVGFIYAGTSFENVNAYVMGSEVYRIAGFRDVAATGVILLISYWRIPQFFSRRMIFLVPAVAICGALFLLSGFRAFILVTAVTVFVVAAVDLRFKAFLLPLGGAVALILLAMGHGQLYELPPAAQRVLSFLPGDWDYQVKKEALDTVIWRWELWDYFLRKYFPGQEWFGNGMLYELADGTQYFMASMGVPVDSVITVAQGRSWHNGVLAALDSVGIVGATCWLLTLILIGKRVLAGLMRIYRRVDTAPVRFFTALTLYWGLFNIYADGITQSYIPLMVSAALLDRFLALESDLVKIDAQESATTYSYA